MGRMNDQSFKQRGAGVIKWIRNNHGLSQVELAKKLGVTQSCISKIENASISLAAVVLLNICDSFNISTRVFTESNWQDLLGKSLSPKERARRA